jgi:homoserine O-acetyltransferase
MGPTIYQYNQPFALECGVSLPKLKIAYHTYGEYTPGKKVAWVCHALTANSEVIDWWKGLIGEGSLINPNDYYIICANIVGSCYGSTGPLSVEDLGTEIS